MSLQFGLVMLLDADSFERSG